MEFRLNKSSEFPIYKQLKEQIKYFLLSDALKPGTRVPSPKDLASYLQINRNTVIAAYKELEKEGLLVTKHGQGTYISETIPTLPNEEEKQALISLAKETIERAEELGFSAEDLFTVIFNQTVLGIDPAKKQNIRLLLIECNKPDLSYFQKEMQKELEVSVDACLLSELADKAHDESITDYDLVVTTFPHVEDVRAILEPLGKEVVAIMAAPHFHTFIRIADLPAGSRVALICANESGVRRMWRSLEVAGIHHITLEYSGTEDKEALGALLNRVDWAVCSRVVIDTIKTIVPPNVQIMEFSTVLDQAGIQMLKQLLKKHKG